MVERTAVDPRQVTPGGESEDADEQDATQGNPASGEHVSEDLTTLAVPFRGVLGPLAIPVKGLLLLAVVFALYAGRAFLVPVAAAVLLNFLLAPVVRGLGRVGLPHAAGAALVMLTVLGVVGSGVYRLAGPAQDWIRSAPQTLVEARARVEGFYRSVGEVREAVDDIGSGTEGGAWPSSSPRAIAFSARRPRCSRRSSSVATSSRSPAGSSTISPDTCSPRRPSTSPSAPPWDWPSGGWGCPIRPCGAWSSPSSTSSPTWAAPSAWP